MPKAIKKIEVEVKQTDEGDKRRVAIEVRAPRSMFSLSDLLCQGKAIGTLEARLRGCCRKATLEYIGQGRELLSIVKERKGTAAPQRAKLKATS